MSKKAAIMVEQLSYRYPGSEGMALRGVTASITEGSFIVIVGPSGCGKSTLLMLLRGFASELGGEITGSIKVLEEDVTIHSPSDLTHLVGIVFQNPATQLHQLRVIDEVASVFIYRGAGYDQSYAKAEELMSILLDKELAYKVSDEISAGQQQKVAITAALALDAPILLLDEPFSFLDNRAQRDLLERLRNLHEAGITIVVATHDYDLLAPLVDQVVVLKDGRSLMNGPPEDIFFDPLFAEILPPPLSVQISTYLGTKSLDWSSPAQEPSDEGGSRGSKYIANNGETKLLEMLSVSFSYGGQEFGLKDVCLGVHRGEIIGIIGANGAGKTTLARVILGFLRPNVGSIQLLGDDISSWDRTRRAKTIGYVTQNPRDMFLESKLLDEVAFGPKTLGLPEPEKLAEQTLNELGLAARIQDHPDSLSGGQRSLLALADVLVVSPLVLILDEPEFGLDPYAWRTMMARLKRLKEQGHGIIVFTHDLKGTLFLCDRCVLMERGKIVAIESPQRLLSDAKLLKSSGLSPPPFWQILPLLNPESDLANEGQFAKAVAKIIQLRKEGK